jgi:L-2-hydroxycarboxylate dehydrogenase (NAD+)
MSEPRSYSVEHLHRFVVRVFERMGLQPADAVQAADILVAADRRGIDSHGIMRLKAYCELLRSGRANPRPNVTVIRETASTAAVDGDGGLGLVVGPRANAIAMAKADAAGSGWVTVRNSQHFGIAGYYVMTAADRGLIGWAMTNAAPQVAPAGGAAPMLGTNPIAVGFPAGEEPQVVIDMATSAVAFGKVVIAKRDGRSIPEGWVMNGAGRPTTDPAVALTGGALLPLGSTPERGAHKGYCLGALVDLLCGVLGGAAWGPFVLPFLVPQRIDLGREVGKGIGHFFGALRIDGFMDPAEFRTRIDDWCRTFRATPPGPGVDRVLVPGDPERRAEADRSANGVPLAPAVVADLRTVSEQTGVPFE